MADSFTANKNLVLQQTGSNINTWGIDQNANLISILDNNLGGTLALNAAGNSNITLSGVQAENIMVDASGALTGSIDLIWPAQGGFWVVENLTTGNFTITAQVTGGSGNVIIPQNQRVPIVIDSTGPTISRWEPSQNELTTTTASTVNLGAVGSNVVKIAGSTTITSFGSLGSPDRPIYYVRFTGSPLLTYNSTSLILPTATNIQANPGDTSIWEDLGSGNWKCLFYNSTIALSSIPSPPIPQGRLTLTSGVPLMNSDVSGGTTIYYANYQGNNVPIYNGSSWIPYSIGAQLSLVLDSSTSLTHTGSQTSGNIFDLFAFINGTTPTLGTGPGWLNATTRNSPVGYLQGIAANTSTISMKIDNTTTQVVVSTASATYLGTMYASGNGQCTVQFKTAAANGGGNNIVGLWNAYNRVPVSSMSRDNTANWTYTTTVWREADNSASNRISWIDGLGQTAFKGHYGCSGAASVAGAGAQIGMLLNATSGSPNVIALNSSPTVTLADNISQLVVEESFSPVKGFNFIQAVEQAGSASTATFNISGASQGLIYSGDF
jgi:hypothetical protein